MKNQDTELYPYERKAGGKSIERTKWKIQTRKGTKGLGMTHPPFYWSLCSRSLCPHTVPPPLCPTQPVPLHSHSLHSAPLLPCPALSCPPLCGLLSALQSFSLLPFCYFLLSNTPHNTHKIRTASTFRCFQNLFFILWTWSIGKGPCL